EALAANLSAEVTDEALRAFYDEQIANAPAQQEVRARHILVETEEEALAVLERLESGEEFEALAAELTIDPSGKATGGDLGYFGRGRMVPAFETAAFELEPGAVSAPVQSQFGYHVIKSEDRRDLAPPSFEELEGRIREALGRQAQQAYVERLREGAEIVRAEAPAQ
ncbi:MAG: peptidylprolyl isomerase, partial [Pseudomonadota bacterium]